MTPARPELHARFETLVLPHLGELLAFARRRTHAPEDAEDLVQEACVRAWQGIGELREASSARPWLYRILRSVLGDAHEKAGRRQRLVSFTRLEAAHESLLGGDADALFEEVLRRLDAEAIHAALREVPEDFATPVELHDLVGFKYHEIADILGIPLGTVMSRISRGRRLLAGALVARLRRRPAAARDAHDARE
ncbi:RNA polymerase sigma factor, partial [Roseisolibacter sp. H3M3-2]|uniref:RNA polymerase sigma factor n=1 Tax=Roseisolibacter sp. H3M3-2 TaxID=3031323 RepID=UPI0023DAFF3E